MAKVAFIGFGEVNTPVEVIISRTTAAAEALEKEGLDLVKVIPVADDYEEVQIKGAIETLAKDRYDAVVLCVGGWIPTHAVIKIAEHSRHLPMVLWGLCGWMEDGRIVTTADQAGTTGLRAALEDLGCDFGTCEYLISAIDDNFASPSKPCDLYDYVGLSPEKIAERMK